MSTLEKLKVAAMAALALLLYLVASTMEYHDNQRLYERGIYYDHRHNHI